MPTHSNSRTSRQKLEEIIKTNEEMRERDTPVSEDAILDTMQGAVSDMIRVCKMLLKEYPRLLSDSTYRVRVIEIFQNPMNFILHIKGD